MSEREALAKHVVLVGLPGVGKTTVGRAVARILGRPFVDLDLEIERSFGKTVAEVFASHGEAEFRAREAERSRAAVDFAASVIAPGGGWVANALAVAHLRPAGRIIYLRVSPSVAVRRMGRGKARRPLLAAGNPYAAMRALFESRKSLYEGCADSTVETDGIPRSDVVARVVELVLAGDGPADGVTDQGNESGNDRTK